MLAPHQELQLIKNPSFHCQISSIVKVTFEYSIKYHLKFTCHIEPFKFKI